MPVVAAVKRRRQLARRQHIFVRVEIVRDLVRILLVHARQREVREALGGLLIEFGGGGGDGDEEKAKDRAFHAGDLNSVRDVQAKIGMARQLSAAAQRNALPRPKRSPIRPTSSEPEPMPASKAQTMLPNVRALRCGSVAPRMNEANAGYALPKPQPNTIAETTSSARVSAHASSANAIGMQTSAG